MEVLCNCKFYFWNGGLFDSFKYSSLVSSIKIREPCNADNWRPRITHQQNKADYHVEGLSIIDEVVNYFPRGLCDFFPRMTHLEIRSCDLMQVSREDFVGLESLEHLSLCYNHLKSLPDNLFVNMRKLNWIDLSYNRIQHASSKLFEPIVAELMWVDLRKNAEIDEYFKKNKNNSIESFLNKINVTCTFPTVHDNQLELRIKELEEALRNQVKKQIPSRTAKVPSTKPVVAMRSSSPAEPSRIQELKKCAALEEHFNVGNFADFTIVIRNKEFKVHKIILASQSSVFNALFTNDKEKGEKCLKKLKSFDEKTFEDFLKFFYTGDIRNEDNAMELFELAVEFEVSALKFLCEEIIIRNLSKSKALQAFTLGHVHSNATLKEAGFEEIKRHFPEISDRLIDDAELVRNIVNVISKHHP